MILMATCRWMGWVWLASQTSPIPPSPIRSRNRYGPIVGFSLASGARVTSSKSAISRAAELKQTIKSVRILSGPDRSNRQTGLDVRHGTTLPEAVLFWNGWRITGMTVAHLHVPRRDRSARRQRSLDVARMAALPAILEARAAARHVRVDDDDVV